jgi:hypothetical protein
VAHDDPGRPYGPAPHRFAPEPQRPHPRQSYTWEALRGVVLQAELLSRAGYPAWSWQDKAILRAFTRIHALGFPAAGDDEWQPWLVNRRYGTAFPAPTRTHPGKSFGYADWLYGT